MFPWSLDNKTKGICFVIKEVLAFEPESGK